MGQSWDGFLMTRSELIPVFQQGPEVRGAPRKHWDEQEKKFRRIPGEMIGRGIVMTDLISMGFDKGKLKKLARLGILKQTYCTVGTEVRCIFVLPYIEGQLCETSTPLSSPPPSPSAS